MLLLNLCRQGIGRIPESPSWCAKEQLPKCIHQRKTVRVRASIARDDTLQSLLDIVSHAKPSGKAGAIAAALALCHAHAG
jgi:hypothetical protein